MGERPDRGERNPSLSVSLTFPFSLSRSLSLLLCAHSLSSREPGWLQNQTANESTQLSTPSLHFSNNSRSLLSYSSLKHHLSLLRPSLWFSLCLSECQRVSHAPTAEGRAQCTSVYIETVPLIFRSKSRSL